MISKKERLPSEIEKAEAKLHAAQWNLQDAQDTLQDAENEVQSCKEALDKLHQQAIEPTDEDIVAACRADPRQIDMAFTNAKSQPPAPHSPAARREP